MPISLSPTPFPSLFHQLKSRKTPAILTSKRLQTILKKRLRRWILQNMKSEGGLLIRSIKQTTAKLHLTLGSVFSMRNIRITHPKNGGSIEFGNQRALSTLVPTNTSKKFTTSPKASGFCVSAPRQRSTHGNPRVDTQTLKCSLKK